MTDVANAKRNIGPTGQAVASNLRRLRESQNLTYAAVVKKLDGIGHPLLPLSVRRMEEGVRAVDADDLAALAIVYGVSPITLLMPDVEQAEATVSFTGRADVARSTAWWWLKAEGSLDGGEPDSVAERLQVLNSTPRWARLDFQSLYDGGRISRMTTDPREQENGNGND